MNIIGANSDEAYKKSRASLLPPIRNVLTDAWIETTARRLGKCRRKCKFDTVVTLLSCILQHTVGLSVRNIEDSLALSAAELASHFRADGADFCRARLALPLALFRETLRFLGLSIQTSTGQLWHGLTVYFVDGTTVPVFNSKQNRATFGGSSNQNGASRLPIARVVLLVSAGAIVDLVCGPYAASELRLFAALLRRLAPNSLVVGDTLYNTYYNFAAARARGAHLLCKSRADRKGKVVEVLGKRDRVHEWDRPRRAQSVFSSAWETLPKTQRVREITSTVRIPYRREYVLTLTTTMLDPIQYPAEEIVALYLARWNIELDLRTLKALHGWNRLNCKTPQSVYREVFSGALAFNAVRLVMAQSGERIRTLSHARACCALIETAWRMAEAPTWRLPELYRRMLVVIARANLDTPDRPSEPRRLAYNLRRFPFLKSSRAEWRKAHALVS
jgi:hypothetical protein